MSIIVEDPITPGTYDLPAMIHGTNYEFGIVIRLDGETSEPKNLTGCAVAVELLDNSGLIATLTSASGLVLYPTEGGVLIQLDDTIVSQYPLGELLYRLRITETSGEIYRYMEGRIPVRE